MSPRLATLVLALFVTGCLEARPETPVIVRDLARAEVAPDGAVRFSSPQIAPHRTTADGRIGVQVQGGAPQVRFYLFAPEKLDRALLEEEPGPKILADPDPFILQFPPPGFQYPDNGIDYTRNPDRITGHHALCDPTMEFPTPGEQTNPYPCPNDPARDCYDFTLINNTAHVDGTQMWGVPVHAEVSNPKTAQAKLEVVELGELVEGVFLPDAPEWTEPMVTRDGRLLTGRIGIAPLRTWTNPETGEALLDFYDIMYSQLPDAAAPCDVTGWQVFHPISHAPYDPRMIGRYGIAAYPFRDAEGNLIPDGVDIGGSYPWVDETGANLFLTTVPERLGDQPDGVFPARCVTPGCEALGETESHDIGYAVAGLWTHGKMVLLDSMVNHVDWQIPVDPDGHRLVGLYRSPSDPPESVEVRVGSGRSLGRRVPVGFSGNPNILHSVENLLNHQANLRTLTPRDVVWLVSTGIATDEVAFDDYLNPDGFIVSNMQASVTKENVLLGGQDVGGIIAFLRYHNGKHWFPGPRFYSLDIHIQNAATSLPHRWSVPTHGLVRALSGRIEPVAMGGIRGKGFWLSGYNTIEYTIPPQPRDIRAHDWYMGIFVDPRDDDDARELLRFPDDTSIWIAGRSELQYRRAGGLMRRIDLPVSAPDSGWIHLGWNLLDGNREVVLFHDGFALDRHVSAEPLFELEPGVLSVGDTDDPTPGLRGWVDDFKIFAQPSSFEIACNHAYGTLIEVGGNLAWQAVAARYPAEHHAALGRLLGEGPRTRFACYHDHGADAAAHGRNLPDQTVGLREALNFPEGPLRAGAPRPDSSQNSFCLTCHHAAGQMGLSIGALDYRPQWTAEDDPRRQPLQGLRRVFGNIPGGWIPPGEGPGSPADAVVAPPEGLLVDRWTLP